MSIPAFMIIDAFSAGYASRIVILSPERMKTYFPSFFKKSGSSTFATWTFVVEYPGPPVGATALLSACGLAADGAEPNVAPMPEGDFSRNDGGGAPPP